MNEEVIAESLEVGDLIELQTVHGPQTIRLTTVEPRANGIKFTGLRSDGARYSFGMRYGQLAVRSKHSVHGPETGL